MTHYETLGVAPDAPPEEIVKAYRRLALEYHPDRVPEHLTELRKDAEEKFKTISEAFAVLSNPAKRQQYDAELRRQQGHRGGQQSRAEERRRAEEEARKRAEDEALQEALRRYHRDAAEKIRQRRLKALERKKRMLILSGVLVVLGILSPLLIMAARWANETGHGLWWRASAVVSNPDEWWLEDLRLHPVSTIEKDHAPNASATLRGYVKGLSSCYVIPARGSVVSVKENRAIIRVDLRRHGEWNKQTSFMGTCTESFAPIEAYLEGNVGTWTGIDLVAVDWDAGLERAFTAPEVKWLLER